VALYPLKVLERFEVGVGFEQENADRVVFKSDDCPQASGQFA
jgi:hypothetical protein